MATTLAAPVPQILSGFCGYSGYHDRCPGALGTRERPVTCACTCHRTCPTCGQRPAVQR